MSLWSRIANTLCSDRLNREIDEELRSHLQEAAEHGRDPKEAIRALGPALSLREQSRDFRLLPWLDSVRMDAVFGWRQIRKNKVISAVAVLSLGLGIGACTAAFRLLDALLLRPLPISEPGRLYDLLRRGRGPQGEVESYDTWAYPAFVQMREAVKGKAELIAVSLTERSDLTYGGDLEMEKANVQYVSGWMFSSLGLHPAIGRLLTATDDTAPGAHPVAVISDDYWKRRFARDPKVVGRTFQMGTSVYQIVGVVDGPFSGTETGTMTAIFVPTMMNSLVQRNDSTWHKTLMRLTPGANAEAVRQQLAGTSRAFEAERLRGISGIPRDAYERTLNQELVLESAAAGVSDLRRDYRRSLIMMAVLVGLVLLIACANVANLITAQAAARSREMALRVSLGAARARLARLVMLESFWIALLAAATGSVFAWWVSPFVVSRINPPSDPAQLWLPLDWRVFGFGFGLTLAVMVLFGSLPALRASQVVPARVLKGDDDPIWHRRFMHLLIAGQVAFCSVVLLAAGLFIASAQRLNRLPLGFSPERVVALETVSPQPQAPAIWDQELEHLRSVPGVESVAIASAPLLSGWSWNNVISVNGAPPNLVSTYMLSVSPGWLHVMRIPLLSGRDFRAEDAYPGAAIVNQEFAREYFSGIDPVGKRFEIVFDHNVRRKFTIVGMAGDVAYREPREPNLAQAYFPFRVLTAAGALRPRENGTIVVRTSVPDPMSLESVLRREVPAGRAEFRVSNLLTQSEIDLGHTVRERLLATLSLFFAAVALLLAGIGLYGVLNYSVLQRRREIGIRMAVGAQATNVARLVISRMLAAVSAGVMVGLILGLLCAERIQALLFQVRATDAAMLIFPLLAIAITAVGAALPAVLSAVHTDPWQTLRAD